MPDLPGDTFETFSAFWARRARQPSVRGGLVRNVRMVFFALKDASGVPGPQKPERGYKKIRNDCTKKSEREHTRQNRPFAKLMCNFSVPQQRSEKLPFCSDVSQFCADVFANVGRSLPTIGSLLLIFSQF